MGITLPIYGTHPIVSTAIYVLIIIFILWPLQYYSTKTMGQHLNFDALVSFNPYNIVIKHNNKDLIENKSWDWIKHIEVKKR